MIDKFEKLSRDFAAHAPKVDYWSLRLLSRHKSSIHFRQNLLQPMTNSFDCGAFVTVKTANAAAYAATSDISLNGLLQAANTAKNWAMAVKNHQLLSHGISEIDQRGEYHSPLQEDVAQSSQSELIEWVGNACAQLKIHAKIVDWQAGQSHINHLAIPKTLNK